MNTTMLIPWNWSRKEDNCSGGAPVRKARPQTYFMPVDPFYREMDRFIDSLFGSYRAAGDTSGPLEPAQLRPSLDISGDSKQYFVTVELPGVDEKDLRVELDKDSLRIYGEKKHEVEQKDDGKEPGKNYYRMERSYGSFQRVLTLPEDADTAGITASHKDGVLTITVPRQEAAEPENRTIAVNKQ